MQPCRLPSGEGACYASDELSFYILPLFHRPCMCRGFSISMLLLFLTFSYLLSLYIPAFCLPPLPLSVIISLSHFLLPSFPHPLPLLLQSPEAAGAQSGDRDRQLQEEHLSRAGEE